MGTADDSEGVDTLEELAEQTQGPRARIIDGLQFYNGEAHSKQLRKYGDIPSGRYHFNKLLDQDVIEKVGEKHAGRGGTASVYQLTDLGEDLADELGGALDAGATVSQLVDRLDQQQETIEGLEDEIEELQQRYNALADYVEGLN